VRQKQRAAGSLADTCSLYYIRETLYPLRLANKRRRHTEVGAKDHVCSRPESSTGLDRSAGAAEGVDGAHQGDEAGHLRAADAMYVRSSISIVRPEKGNI
jgi:hypothetical protein